MFDDILWLIIALLGSALATLLFVKLSNPELIQGAWIASAHRTPEKVREWTTGAISKGMKVIIAAAGMSAALPGVVAAYTTLPVIGVPMKSDLLGLDSLLSISQMPKGVPVACMSIGKHGAINAALFAERVIKGSYRIP